MEPPPNPPAAVGSSRWKRPAWLTLGFLAALIAAVGYTVVLGFLSLAKYSTFHATFLDLGLENEVLWLLAHGGLHGYYSSGFAQIYPFQYQKPILFLVLPIYFLFPHPETLLALATLTIGGAAIPLFLFARRVLLREPYALVLVGAYLLFFPVAAANLFDFHYEDFAPLGFFTMAWCWSSGRRRGLYIASALTAAINPLVLVLVIFFHLFTLLPAPRRRIDRAWAAAVYTNLFADRARLAAMLLLAAMLPIYSAAGVLYTAGLATPTTPAPPANILFDAINFKLTLLLLLFGSLAFVPLYSLRGVIATLPYFGFVAYSQLSANFTPFGVEYPLLVVGPLLVATVDALAAASPETRRSSTEISPDELVEPRVPPRDSESPHFPRHSERSSSVWAIVATTLLFALVFFPVSPANSFVSGGYFSGNHDLANITQATAATEFLNQVVALVPADASVLTQNNIPQLSGREHIQTAPLYQPSIPYDTILMDTELSYFSRPLDLAPFVNASLENGSFGIVAEGQGALLLEKGFTGAPLLYQPYQQTFTGSSFRLFDATLNGSTIVGSGPSFSLWYGPYATLYPGNYSCAFTIASNTTAASLGRVLTIDVTGSAGKVVYATADLKASNFTAPNTPNTFFLHFHLARLVVGVEFRGMFPTGGARLTLEQVVLQQTGYHP